LSPEVAAVLNSVVYVRYYYQSNYLFQINVSRGTFIIKHKKSDLPIK